MKFGFEKLGRPLEFDTYTNNQWRGADDVITQIQKYSMVNGWRSKKVIRDVISKCLEEPKHDAGVRSRMREPRQRKMDDEDVELTTNALRHGAGTIWATCYLNHDRIHNKNKEGVDRSTMIRTMTGKYNASVHRRQKKKPTGSNEKESKWAKARFVLAKQFLFQIGK